MFLEDPILAQNLAQAESGASFGILGPGLDLGSKKRPPGPKTQKMCTENHADPRLQNSKWSHMVQVIAQSHFGPLVAKTLFNQGPRLQMGHSGCTGHIWNLAFFLPYR